MENKKKEIKKELFELFYNLHDGKKHVYVTNKIKRNLLRATVAVDIPNARGEYSESDCESICLEELSDFINTIRGYREYLDQIKYNLIFSAGELIDELGDEVCQKSYDDMKENLILFLTSLNKKIEEFLSIINNLMIKTLLRGESSIYDLRESTIKFADNIVKGLDDIHERLNKYCFELATHLE